MTKSEAKNRQRQLLTEYTQVNNELSTHREIMNRALQKTRSLGKQIQEMAGELVRLHQAIDAASPDAAGHDSQHSGARRDPSHPAPDTSTNEK
jgi:hypothetical protein